MALVTFYFNNNKISSNKLKTRNYTIALTLSKNNQIKYNQIINSNYSIMVLGGSKNQIAGNKLEKNILGITIINSNYNTISKNTIISIKNINSSAINMNSSCNNKIYSNNIKYGLSGIMLITNCKNNDIKYNTLKYVTITKREYKGFGIVLYANSDSNKIRSNTFYKKAMVIPLYSVNKNLIESKTIKKGYIGEFNYGNKNK